MHRKFISVGILVTAARRHFALLVLKVWRPVIDAYESLSKVAIWINDLIYTLKQVIP